MEVDGAVAIGVGKLGIVGVCGAAAKGDVEEALIGGVDDEVLIEVTSQINNRREFAGCGLAVGTRNSKGVGARLMDGQQRDAATGVNETVARFVRR